MASDVVSFGPWQPDAIGQVPAEGAVRLRDAKNVLWSRGGYRPWPKPASFGAAASSPTAGYVTGDVIFAFNATSAQVSTDAGATWTACGSGFGGGAWDFAEYGDCVYAANGVDTIQAADRDGSVAFADVSNSAPVSKVVGVIRDFVVAGNIVSSPIGAPEGGHVLQWSGLAAPATWEVPNTQAARAEQSGAQTLNPAYGDVTFIADGESMGLVFQERGIVRVQYVGGEVVFSFYTFERKHGAIHGNACAQAGNTVYFLAGDGFYATDGSNVEPIGYGQVNRWFQDDCTDTASVRCAMDAANQCVVWSYTSSAETHQVAFNVIEKQWTHADHAVPTLIQGLDGNHATPWLFDAAGKLAAFDGTVGQADLITGDMRLAPGQHTLVNGAQLLSDATTWTIGVSARNNADDAPSYAGFGVPETGSRHVSLRADGYIHAFNARITGNFGRVDGLRVYAETRGLR